ncbi:MAG: hypothetical protein ACLP8S_26625 [Solirubrobacteraceae bacterium]
MSIRNHWKLGAVALSGLAIGAGASAITSAGAATSTRAAMGPSVTQPGRSAGITLRRLAARTVAGDLTVETKAGFVTVTFERGFVQSVNGQQLTMTEGTRKATYQTVTITIPTTARVVDNGKASTLATLSSGQHVLVIQGPKQTLVRARTARTP